MQLMSKHTVVRNGMQVNRYAVLNRLDSSAIDDKVFEYIENLKNNNLKMFSAKTLAFDLNIPFEKIVSSINRINNKGINVRRICRAKVKTRRK